MTVKEFYDQIASDKDLQDKMAGFIKDGKSIDEIISALSIEGTADDMKAYVDQLAGEGHLDKSQLDTVAGGTTPAITAATLVPDIGATIGTVYLATC